MRKALLIADKRPDVDPASICIDEAQQLIEMHPNRVSPHLHLLVWIKNVPSFDTPEGIALINKVISCSCPSEEEDPGMYNLVNQNQIHRHTHTCFKTNAHLCSFAFPHKPICQAKIIEENSTEFLQNGGRFCELKRAAHEKWVNNYYLEILQFWDGNMDIQPCRFNEALAHYVTKYIAKVESEDLNDGVIQAINRIRQEESDIQQKLFKICMRILKE
ncbi:helitron_like_N domain-containing protein [Nephila pilipes]|uniref:Helitron_like_N domain-containing protein n=1 Tax=Nephila pilipes TaxID=299642 RepID=A0A8X6QF34_NEPPI|nr:helitron_like_N domain-containing protein [Nephila pilipes]